MKLKFDNSVKYCFFDYETEGLNLISKKPVQAAYYIYDGQGFKETKSFFINWELAGIPLQIDPGAEKATKISRQLVIDKGIHPQEALEINNAFFHCADYVAGHNVLGFDLHIYATWCRLLGQTPLPVDDKVIDTLALAKGVSYEFFYEKGMDLFLYMMSMTNYWERGHKRKLTIGALAKSFEIPFDSERLHNALYDIEINAKIWQKLKYQIDI